MTRMLAILTAVSTLMGVNLTTLWASSWSGAFSSSPEPPPGWTLSGGVGAWEPSAGLGGRSCFSVTGTGDDSNFWRHAPVGLQPNTIYLLRFHARITEEGPVPRPLVAGLDSRNFNLYATTQWQSFSFIFTTPEDLSGAFLRFGQWHVKASALFSDIEILPVQPVYRPAGTISLGAGEKLTDEGYEYASVTRRTYSARPLVAQRAGINGGSWLMHRGSEVVWRHELPGVQQTSGQVGVKIGEYQAGDCLISASRDGKSWVEVGRATGDGETIAQLPESLFPAEEIWVMVRGDAPGDDPAAVDLQIDSYSYKAGLDKQVPPTIGATWYLAIAREDEALRTQVEDLGGLWDGSRRPLHLTLLPAEGTRGKATVTLVLSQINKTPRVFTRQVDVTGAGPVEAIVPYDCDFYGDVRMAIEVKLSGAAAQAFAASTTGWAPVYREMATYGYGLGGAPAGDLWWCENTYKIHPGRLAPTGASDGIRLSAARREREAAQLVLRAGSKPGAIEVSADDLTGPGGAVIPAAAVRIRRVAYVPVHVPFDKLGAIGDWPDPLPPLEGPWQPKPDLNNPLWLTVSVPADARAGDYVGAIRLKGPGWEKTVPLRLHVWDFTLPKETALRSGFGLSFQGDFISKYHCAKTEEARRKLWDLYMQDFAEHRLCPFAPMKLTPYKMSVATGADGLPHVSLDFTDFDQAAHRYLDELGFNSFVIPFSGLGGGRYPDYVRAAIGGFEVGTPEYDRIMTEYGRLLTDHLREKGWLDKAYVYAWDEPGLKDYPFLRGEMERQKHYAPGLKTFITAKPEGALLGVIDIWCPNTEWNNIEETQARQKLGEEAWWYLCMGPREPWATLFIDHPATDLRVWLWQTWQYKVDGLLVWATDWWAGKDEAQNVWRDPMSYNPGDAQLFGNGDGRFFYPPEQYFAGDRSENICAPINSIRWEILSEGVEDWEYFHLLDGLVREAEARGDDDAVVRQAKGLLAVPADVSRDMTHYTFDPQPIYAHRARLAEAIEKLSER